MSFNFEKNQQGNDMLLRNGYRYNLQKTNKGGSTLWRCGDRRKCHATITLNRDKDKVLRDNLHTCYKNETKNKEIVLTNKCKLDVTANLAPIPMIFEKHFEGNTSVSFYSKKDSLYRARKKFLDVHRTTFERLEDIEIPAVLADDFLVWDEGIEDRIIIFCLKSTLKYLQECKNPLAAYGDGTFKRVPKPFYQLFTLHIDLNIQSNEYTAVVPVVFGLLPDKTTITYERFFLALKNLGISIQKYKSDFELAQIKAVKNVFELVKASGCYYHYSKAIWKKSRDIGFADTRNGRIITNLISKLPLLPAAYIPEAWMSIVEIGSEENGFDNLKYYIDKQWMLKITPQILSCSHQKNRTNNALEGWHHRFNVRMPPKPTLFLFIQNLVKEAKYQSRKLYAKNVNQLLRKRRKCDVDFDRTYKKYLKILLRNEVTPINFLRKIKKSH